MADDLPTKNTGKNTAMEILENATRRLTLGSSDTEIDELFIYVVGGHTEAKYDYLYICKKDQWMTIPSCKRAYLSCCIINKKIYLIGGRVESGSLDTVLVLDGPKWSILPMRLMSERSESAVAVANEKIWVVGGYNQSARTVEVYDPTQKTQGNGPKLQQGRWGHRVAAVNNVIYAFGGHRYKKYFNSMEKLDLGGKRWISCEGMHRRRAYFASVALPPFIFVFGGCGGVTNSNEVNRLSSAERYDIRTGEWTLLKDMPSARSNMSAVKWGKRILIIGGFDGNRGKLQEILEYDPQLDCYQKLSISLPRWRFSHCSASE